MRSYRKLALLVFIAIACLTATSRAEEEAVVDTPVNEEVDVIVEYDSPVEEITPEEAEEVIDTIEEAPEPPEEVVEPIVDEENEKEVTIESESELAPEPSITAKISEITLKLKTQLSKQDAKKIAAVGLGAWGAATGVGWIAEKLGKPVE